jgi:hypothetical protein
MPAGAGSITMVGGEAGENKALNFRRVYMDIMLPVGKLRVGRQPSHWGLGIFQNDGNERQGDFGDTADRVMFLTQYEFDDEGTLAGGVLWDYVFSAQYDPRIEGLAGAMPSLSRGTQQYAAVILYDRSDFSVGLFGGLRRRGGTNGNTTTTAQGALCIPGDATWGTDQYCSIASGIDGSTMLYFVDAYGRYTYEEYDVKAEYVFLTGRISTGVAINAIPFSVYQGGAADAGIINLPARQDVQVSMAALEATGAYSWGGEWNLKGGFAQGDATPLSQRITQYGFRPDYQIALLMFHVPLGTSPSLWGTNSHGTTNTKLAGGVPITGNFINNAVYASTGYKHHFDISSSIKHCNDFSVGAQVTTAWAQKNPVDLNFQTLLSDTTLPILRNSAKWYGIEVDISAEMELYDHIYAALDGGVLVPGAAYNIQVDESILGTLVQQIPYDKADIAYGGRLTLMLEF